tara:strand:- start:223 stop:426 length:204 start_codon:yes stop_codon:yes gene_type:complete
VEEVVVFQLLVDPEVRVVVQKVQAMQVVVQQHVKEMLEEQVVVVVVQVVVVQVLQVLQEEVPQVEQV